MPIHMGVICEACKRVYFVATSPRIKPSRTAEGMYRLNCTPSCPEPKEFRKEGMHPYRISDDVFQRGYAEKGEYEIVVAA